MYQLRYFEGLGWCEGQTEVQKRVRGGHLARWGHIEPRTAVGEGFKVPEQVREFIWSENLTRTHIVPSGHLGSGTNNYDLSPKPLQPLRFGDGSTHAAVVPDRRSLLQPPARVIWSEIC
jgi:hypothetical protein